MNAFTIVLGALLCTQFPTAPCHLAAGPSLHNPSIQAAPATVPVALAPIRRWFRAHRIQGRSHRRTSRTRRGSHQSSPRPLRMVRRPIAAWWRRPAGSSRATTLSMASRPPPTRSIQGSPVATELRFLSLFDWSRPSTPVIGGGPSRSTPCRFESPSTDRLQLFADKDGLVQAFAERGQFNLRPGEHYGRSEVRVHPRRGEPVPVLRLSSTKPRRATQTFSRATGTDCCGSTASRQAVLGQLALRDHFGQNIG